MRVGVLKIANPQKGLGKCADTLAWALAGKDVSLYPVWSVAALYRRPDRDFLTWSRRLDVLITIEQFLPRVVHAVQRAGVRVVFVPNLDWAVLHETAVVSRWVDAVAESGVEVWARTRHTKQALAGVGLASTRVGWSIADAVRRRPRRAPGDDVVFLLNAGRGGWQRRRGVDIALKAFAVLRRQRRRARLILKTLRPVRDIAGDAPLDPAVTVVEGWLPPEDLLALRRSADVVLHPSRWEGLGYPMLEALHDGVPVLATDGWPMNEFVVHDRTGLLVRATHTGSMCLAARWECDPGALAAAMLRMVDEPELRARLTCATPQTWLARQRRFREALARALDAPRSPDRHGGSVGPDARRR